MKFLIALSLAAFSVGAFAQNDLNTMKEDATSHIDSKISNLQESKSCIQNAASTEAFKACKYDMHKKMKMQKMEEKHKNLEQEQQRMEDVEKKEKQKAEEKLKEVQSEEEALKKEAQEE